jgi:hypothetical protein
MERWPVWRVRPLAVACTYEGTILVLEENRTDETRSQEGIIFRISAYDLYMNPVARFRDAKNAPSLHIAIFVQLKAEVNSAWEAITRPTAKARKPSISGRNGMLVF